MNSNRGVSTLLSNFTDEFYDILSFFRQLSNVHSIVLNIVENAKGSKLHKRLFQELSLDGLKKIGSGTLLG